MANLSANITGNIGIKTGNFSLAVALFEVATGFSAANVMLGGSSSGVTFTVTGEGKDYHVNIMLPTDTDLTSFTVSLIGSVDVGGSSCNLVANQKTVNYDTESTISAIFGDPIYEEYEDNLRIRIPTTFASEEAGHTDIIGLDKTDFGLHRLLGDDIFDFDYYITGSGLSYVVNIIPTIEKQGAFSVDIVGHVLKSDGITNEVVLNHAVILYYDTRTPDLVDFEMQTAPADGSPFSVYLDFDIPTTGLLPQDSDKIIYEGITNYGQPILYYAEEVDDENKLPPQDSRTTSNLPSNRDHPYDDNTVEARFFRLEFQSYDILPGEILNIRIKEGAVKGPSGEPVDSLQQQSGIQQRSSRAVVRQTQTLAVSEVYWLGSNNQGPNNFFTVNFNVGTATPSINDMTFSGVAYLDGVLQDNITSDDVISIFQVGNGFSIRFNLPNFDYISVRLQIDAGVIQPDLSSVLPHIDIDEMLTDGDGDPPDPIDPVDPLDEIIPTISIADAEIERGESTTATITFPSAHTGFTIDDLSVDFGSLSNFIIVDTLTYTVDITAPTFSIGDITLTLAANALTGNTNPQVTATISWVAAAFGANWIVPTSPVGLMFTSELRFVVPVSGFILNDIRLRSEDAIAFVLNNQNATITPIAGTNNYLISIDASGEITGSALYSFRLRARSVTYDGLAYPAATIDSPEFTIDDTIGQIATFTITTPTATAISGVPIVFSIASNIVVNGLTDADITVVGGTAEPIQGSGLAYTVRVTPPSTGSGITSLTIRENAVDELNNETSLSINYSPAVVPEAIMIVSITETSANIGDVVVVNVSSNIPVNGLTIDDFTTTNGTLSNFQDLGNNMYSLDLTLPSTGSGNARVRLAAGSVDEGNNAATDVVSYSTPTFFIEPIPEQNIIINTDYELRVTISGNPDEAYVLGILENFGYDWQAANNELVITTNQDSLSTGKVFTIYATKSTLQNPITRSVNYNVVTPAPVIESFGPFDVVKGRMFDRTINIQNLTTKVEATGPWIFLDSENATEGIRIFGDIPSDKEFTRDGGEIIVVAENTGGSDTRSGVIGLTETTAFYLDRFTRQIVKINVPLFTTLTLEEQSFQSFSADISGSVRGYPMHLDGNDLYYANGFSSNATWYVTDIRDLNGDTIVNDRSFIAPAGLDNYALRDFTIIGNEIYVPQANGYVYVISKNTLDGQVSTIIRDFTIPSHDSEGDQIRPSGISPIGNNLYITSSVDQSGNVSSKTVVVSANTPNNTEATVIQEILGISLNPIEATYIFNDRIYYRHSSDTVRITEALISVDEEYIDRRREYVFDIGVFDAPSIKGIAVTEDYLYGANRRGIYILPNADRIIARADNIFYIPDEIGDYDSSNELGYRSMCYDPNGDIYISETIGILNYRIIAIDSNTNQDSTSDSERTFSLADVQDSRIGDIAIHGDTLIVLQGKHTQRGISDRILLYNKNTSDGSTASVMNMTALNSVIGTGSSGLCAIDNEIHVYFGGSRHDITVYNFNTLNEIRTYNLPSEIDLASGSTMGTDGLNIIITVLDVSQDPYQDAWIIDPNTLDGETSQVFGTFKLTAASGIDLIR